ncbi:MAG: bifunctional hydroxymethylpyrimidine kinase/phosphomethylpyrimidine kinase [Peptoniphilaceae bacterium]|nr:bifunctional hydroxymethylpyrimidine kinase/phosphomethylpyrimidine kinase [Peptoniphilaceae bacterium]MDY6018864.1 bifunctional hydroxymethylpyrimidine kinase/phosphomethylpyrimidine kinase [Anaerococcus sp.]
MNKILTISGSDSCGGAGIQADIKAASSRHDYVSSVIVSVVAENTMGLKDMVNMPKELVENQIAAVFEDMGADAVKLGMLPSKEIIEAVSNSLSKYQVKNVVFDPCMVNKSDDEFVKDDSIDVLKDKIFELVDLICPNIPEAKTITGIKIENVDQMKEACKIIYEMGVKNVLLKGGSDIGALDIFYDGKEFTEFRSEKIDSKNTWGSGDVLAMIIASNLAKGLEMKEAIKDAKNYVTEAIKQAPLIGKGFGVLEFDPKLK